MKGFDSLYSIFGRQSLNRPYRGSVLITWGRILGAQIVDPQARGRIGGIPGVSAPGAGGWPDARRGAGRRGGGRAA